MNHTLILRMNNSDYFFPLLKNKNFHSLLKTSNKVFVWMYYLFIKLKLPYQIFYDSWRKQISHYKKVIILDYGYYPEVTKYIKLKNKDCSIHVFFLNHIQSDYMKIAFDDSNVDKIWSFDPNDCEQYGLNYNSTFYTDKIKKTNKEILYDIVFVGLAKKREKIILDFEKTCAKLGLKTDFHIAHEQKDYITYDSYIEKVNQSRAILDITNAGQTGLSLRFMEGLFLSKKVITNNANVREYEFYNKNNIFILGMDNLDDLQEFIYSPYQEIDIKIKKCYEFSSWVERFVI